MSKYALIGIALLAGMLAARGFKEAGEAEARAEMAEQRADSLYMIAVQHEQRRKSDSVRHEIHVRLLEISKREALARADRAAASRPAVVERIVRVAGDSAEVVEAVADLEAVHAVETDALRNALAIADSLLVAERADKQSIMQLSAERYTALQAAREEAKRWELASRPKLFGVIPMSPTTAYVAGVGSAFGVVAWMVLK